MTTTRDPRDFNFETGDCQVCHVPCADHSIVDRAACVKVLNDLDKNGRREKRDRMIGEAIVCVDRSLTAAGLDSVVFEMWELVHQGVNWPGE